MYILLMNLDVLIVLLELARVYFNIYFALIELLRLSNAVFRMFIAQRVAWSMLLLRSIVPL